MKIREVRGLLTAAAGGWTEPSKVRYSIHFSSSCFNSPWLYFSPISRS